MLNQLVKVLCFVVFVGAFSLAQDQTEKDTQQATQAWNTVCPVAGNSVNAEIKTIRYNDKDYGFCSSSCAVVFADDPASFAGNLSEDGTTFVDKTVKPRLEE